MQLLATIRRVAAASALALVLWGPSTYTNAAETGRQKPPQLVSHAELKSELRAAIQGSSTASAQQRLSTGSGPSWVDLTWRLNRMAQAGQELPDLSEFGVVKRPDGSYRVNFAKNPEWETWSLKPSLLLQPEVFELHAQRLRDRGFRESDITILKDYVTSNDPRLVVLEAEKSIIREISARRSSLSDRAAAVSADDAASYVYQLERTREVARKRWAADLLNRLDPQRQRILISFYQELGGSMVFIPEPNFDVINAAIAGQIVSGGFEQQLADKEKEFRQ